MGWTGFAASMGEMRNTHNILVRKLYGKQPLGKPKYMWQDNIKMDLKI
jgi:hypothetical protein